MKKFRFLLLFPFLLLGNELSNTESLQNKDITNISRQEISYKAIPLEIIILKKNNARPPQYLLEETGVFAYEIEIPGGIKKLSKMLTKKYLMEPLSKEMVTNIKTDILEYYRKQGFPIISVTTPIQNVSKGVLQFIIVQAKVGKITVHNNKYVDEKKILKAVSAKNGEEIHYPTLTRDLYWINRNPFREANLIFTSGQEPMTTDLEVWVNDRRQYRFYGGIDDYGNDVTGDHRLYCGLMLGNLFWADQRFDYQYSTSLDFSKFMGHALSYVIPLPWKHDLSFIVGYSHVKADYDLTTLTQDLTLSTHAKGFGLQVSMRYTIPFKSSDSFLHELSFGADFKRTNNNLLYSNYPIVDGYANITQLMASYNLGFFSTPIDISWEIEGFYSPGRIVADQRKSDYQQLRPKSEVEYGYFRSSFSAIGKLPKDYKLKTFLRGQVASCNLLPSEEYGIGGYDTVRGYLERIQNGDFAFVGNVELYAPPLSLINVNKKILSHEELLLLCFFDIGWAKKNLGNEGERRSATLLSVGPGIRYNINTYLSVRLDWGFQLKHLIDNPSHDRLHFTVNLSY